VIRIHKPTTPPEKLAIDGKKKRRSHCVSYSRNPSAYQAGEKKFKFNRLIYAHETVKKALMKAQHKKCCFCERKIGIDGDVEHFRPKQAYQQAKGEPLQYTGYYWLAYEWDNLYLACTGCNQRHKQNLFPLQNPNDRVANHKQNIKQEQPLFIDCGKENPEDFIGFRGSEAYAIDGNLRGEVTIDALQLNSDDRAFPEDRLGYLKKLRTLYDLSKIDISQFQDPELARLAKEAQEQIDTAILDSAKFAAAARWAIRLGFQNLGK